MHLIPKRANTFTVQDSDGMSQGTVYLGGNGYWQGRTLGGTFIAGGPGYHADRGYMTPEIAASALCGFVARGGG